MDEDDDFRKIKLMGIAGLAFLISAWFSWVELKHMVWGAKAEATVSATRVVQRPGGRRRAPQMVLDVDFQYKDSSTGNSVSEDLDFDSDSSIQTGDKFEVQYLPGKAESARLGGSLIPMVFFFGSLGALTWAVVKMSREANSPIPTTRRR